MEGVITELQRKLAAAQNQRDVFLCGSSLRTKLGALSSLVHTVSVNYHPRLDLVAKAMVEMALADALPDDNDPLS